MSFDDFIVSRRCLIFIGVMLSPIIRAKIDGLEICSRKDFRAEDDFVGVISEDGKSEGLSAKPTKCLEHSVLSEGKEDS